MTYRKDIQIVRGIAVLLVVLFHLEVAGVLSGYLGVDVFFVISGFLMAFMYDPADKADFFLKRARRLLPAYFAVVFATLLVAAAVTTPNEYQQVTKQAYFAAMFISNIGFWLENSYFIKDAFNPLLHLWSLGVELQFYLLVPLVHFVFTRFNRLFYVALAASALLCFVVIGISPKTSFFWLPARMWQFLIGFSVAKYQLRATASTDGALKWLGAAAILLIVSLPTLDAAGDQLGFVKGHPGLAALAISLATAAVLCFGLPDRWLANPLADALEKIGDYSYSIYLAHFPVIVLFLYRPFSGTVLHADSFAQTLTLVVLIAVASAALYAGVERPFRRPGVHPFWIAAAMAAVFAVGLGAQYAQRRMIPRDELVIYDAWLDRAVYRCGKLARVLAPRAISCEITAALPKPDRRILLVGNSHADAIKTTFAAAAQAQNVAVHFLTDNSPLTPGGITPERLVAEARARRISLIALHFSPQSLSAATVEKVALLALEANIAVSLILPVPVWEKQVPVMLLDALKKAGKIQSQQLADYRQFNDDLLTGIAKMRADLVQVFPVADVFCRSACQLQANDGRPLYWDAGHLTLTGSDMLRGVFDKVVAGGRRD